MATARLIKPRRLLGPALLGPALLCLFLAGCGEEPAETASGTPPGAEPATLTLGQTQFPSTFHPNIDPMAAKSYILGFSHRQITAYDADWQNICLLCTELPSLENGRVAFIDRPDGSRGVRVTFTLKDQARWADGTPLTTEDVIFTWRTGREASSGYANYKLFSEEIRDITALDDKSFVIEWAEPVCTFDELGSFQLLPAHIERPIFEADPATYRQATAYDTDTANPGLWMGPWKISEVATDSYVVLDRNPEWWGDAPEFDRIVVRTIANTSALEANLLSGEVDVLAGEVGGSLEQALAFQQRYGADWQVTFKTGLFYEHIDLNQDHPALADRQVRQALLYGIDRQALSDELFGGRQPVAHGPINPLDSVYVEDVPEYRFDPERAAALLDEAGWRLGADGLRRNEAGEPLSISFGTTAGNRSRELVQQVLREHWRDLGIEIAIDNQPARIFFGDTTTRREYRGMAMYAWISAPNNPPRTTLHSDFIPTAENGWSGQNYPGYRSAEMDAVLDALKTTCAPEARADLWRRLQVLYAEDLPALPLYFRSVVMIAPDWLRGVEMTGHLVPSSVWAQDWRDARRAGAGP